MENEEELTEIWYPLLVPTTQLIWDYLQNAMVDFSGPWHVEKAVSGLRGIFRSCPDFCGGGGGCL